MPNLRPDRKKARQESAKHRQATYGERGSVARREAERGYPARLNAETPGEKLVREIFEAKPKRRRAR